MVNFTQLQAEFISAYDALFKLLDTLPAERTKEPGVCGAWSTHAILAHFCGWLAEAKRRYERYPRGTGDFQYDADALNEVFVWQRADHTWDALRAELQERVETLHAAAIALDERRLEREDRYAKWLQALTRDCMNHTAEIRQYFAE